MYYLQFSFTMFLKTQAPHAPFLYVVINALARMNLV